MKISSFKATLPVAVYIRVALTISMVNPLVNRQRVPGASALPEAPIQQVLAVATAQL